MSIWKFKDELRELCVKCTSLKPSTAKKYSNDLFNKYHGKVINYRTEERYEELVDLKNRLASALNTVKRGYIQGENSILKLKDISFVKFQDGTTYITLKNQEVHTYGDGWEFLKYVFKYNHNYY